LGLVSWDGNVLVTKDAPVSTAINLHAVVMTPSGGFGAEGYNPFSANYTTNVGTIIHKGSLIRMYAIPTNDGATLGWDLKSFYDPDLADKKAPPYFPGNGKYELRNESNSRVVDRYTFN